jgi:hypothetical protein
MAREAFLVLVTFGDRHQAGALAALGPWWRRLFPDCALRGVVVDNALAGNVEIDIDDNITRISGDNRSREFSGWDRGLAWLESAFSISPEARLVMANDTLHRSYGVDYLDGFTRERLRAAEGGLLGWIDAYPKAVELFGLTLRRWIRTNLWVAARRTLDQLRPVALPFSDESVFAEAPDELFRVPSPLSADYRRYLRSWLSGEADDADFPHTWHSAQPLAAFDPAALRGKLRSILCEHHLSARAQSRALPLIDVR